MPKKKVLGEIVLVHWDAGEARELAAELQAHNWRVQWHAKVDTLELKDLKANPPLAVVISLRRLPSHGREVADAIWYTKWGRAIPIVFCDGEPEKVAATRKKFPAAQFSTWAELTAILVSLEQLPCRLDE